MTNPPAEPATLSFVGGQVARWLMAAAALALAAGCGLGYAVVGWLVALSFAALLLGPGSPLAPETAPLLIFLVPPVLAALAALAVLGWMVARGRLRLPTPQAAAPVIDFECRASSDDAPDIGLELNEPSFAQLDVARPSVRWTVGLVLAGSLGYLAYARLVFQFHRIQGGVDEGIYLYAGKLVMSGLVPYRDFFFDQAPLQPYVIGLALAPFQFSEEAARVFAIACTLAVLLVTFAAAERMGGRLAGLIAFGLLVTNVDLLTEFSAGVQSNGSMPALAVALTALALATRHPWLALVAAAAAAGLRLTLIPLPVVLACYLAFAERRPGKALLTGVALAGLVFGVVLLLGGERAVFGIWRPLRVGTMIRFGDPPTLREQLFASRDAALAFWQSYLPLVVAALAALHMTWRRGHPRWRELTCLGAASLVLLLVNLTPVPANPRYVTTQLPLLAVLGGVAVASLVGRSWGGSGRVAWAPVAVGAGLLLAAGPLLGTRMPTFVEEYSKRQPIEALAEVAAVARQAGGPQGTIITLEPPVATQSGLRLLPGLEAGGWSIVRGWSPERARSMGVVTFDMIAEMLEEGRADVAVESDRYGFLNGTLIQPTNRDRIRAGLDRNYERVADLDPVGDWGRVRVYARRASPG